MIRIALVDDNRAFLDILQKYMQGYFEQHHIGCQIERFFNSIFFFDELMEKDSFDVCFLDIEMPELDGVELAKRLRRNNRMLPIVFLTAHGEYIRAGFETKAFDYLSKNQFQEELPRVLDRLLEEMDINQKRFYTITTNSRIERIPYDSIIYIYKTGQNAMFVLKNSETWERGSLREVMKRLDDDEFMKIERGYIINLAYVSQVNSRNVVLSNGVEIKASRELIGELKERLQGYGVR